LVITDVLLKHNKLKNRLRHKNN